MHRQIFVANLDVIVREGLAVLTPAAHHPSPVCRRGQLVWNPRQTLARLSDFLDYDLDYDRIQVSALGRFRESNSSFRGMAGEELISPVQRWKQRLGVEEVAGIEALVGDCLLKTAMSWQRPKQNEGWDFNKRR